MKKQNKVLRFGALALGVTLCAGTLSIFAGCAEKKEALTVMTDALNGLFNPFFSSAGTDMNVVGQTQLSMLGTDENGNLAYGDSEAVVVKDYAPEIKTEGGKQYTYYTFVLKNGIKFSDGVPLTMNDVLFNMYVYLDPSYTGSSTMYSTDIVGLQDYRAQKRNADDRDDELLSNQATTRARTRRQELIDVFERTGKQGAGTNVSYHATPEQMENAIKTWPVTIGYKEAIAKKGQISDDEARAQLLQDYKDAIVMFEEELGRDYDAARDAFTEEPYKTHEEFKDEVFCFMFYEGFVQVEYVNVEGEGIDRNQIKSLTPSYNQNQVKDKESAINHVKTAKVDGSFNEIMRYWATGSNALTNYISKAKEVILSENMKEDGLTVKSVEGIQSLGHAANGPSTVVVDGTTYNVARDHNEDGTPANANEYDVLQVKINGIDPKAQWNFAFTVAPYHYYSDVDAYPVDIAHNEFGVKFSSFDFMAGVLQGKTKDGINKNKVPLGAGPYVASDVNDSKTPTENGFYNNNHVYYVANENFLLGKPKIERFRYRYVSSSNALGALQTGEVDFVEPQFTNENINTIDGLKSKGVVSVNTWNLGYGYVGVNAGKVKNLNLRKAIMMAMDTELALQYYVTGTAVNVAWPMSVVSWAYPRNEGKEYNGANPISEMLECNGHPYACNCPVHKGTMTEEMVKDEIERLTSLANASPSDLKITFTIAGSNVTEHPLYNTFIKARRLLNECGWDITVSPDANALTKLATGSLSVWAAAWGSTIDPDMYQVYHKKSTATSVLAWGYREILSNQASYRDEYDIISNKLSPIIDSARETNDKTVRTGLYKEAMGYVLDLAVELPVYQRKALYAYNSKVIDTNSLPAENEINSYNSPLSKIWEVELVK